MNTLLSHPATTHMPLAIAILFPILFVTLWHFTHRQVFPRQTWLLAWGLALIQMASGALAFLSGEEAKSQSAADPDLLSSHRVFAIVFTALWVLLFLILSQAVLNTKTSPLSKATRWALLLLALAQLAVAIELGHLGGVLVFG